MKLFLYLVLAHIVGDFFLQNQHVCDEKRDKVLCSPYMYGHAFVIFVLSSIVMFSVKFWFAALIIGISHLCIDSIKSFIEKKLKSKGTVFENRFSLWLFVLDQCIHIIIILIVSWWLVKYHNWSQPEFMKVVNARYLLVIIAFLMCSKPANVLIRLILDYCQVKTIKGDVVDNSVKEDASFKSGALIGVFERWIILAFMLVNQYLTIGYLITAKSILRFGEGERNERIEYILAGTLVSFAIAITCGLFVEKYVDKVFGFLGLFF